MLVSHKRPPIAWVFGRDTACIAVPSLAALLREQMFIIETASHVIPQIRSGVWRLRVIYDAYHNNVEVLGEYERISDMEAVEWISGRLGMDFVEYAVKILVDRYESVGRVAEVIPSEYEHGAAVIDGSDEYPTYIARIDFHNRTVEVWYAQRKYSSFTVQRTELMSIEEAVKELRVPWEAMKRVFAVEVVIRHHRGELIRKINDTLRGKMILDIYQSRDFSYNVKWGKRYEYYSIEVVIVKPEDVCLRVRLDDTGLNKVLSRYMLVVDDSRIPVYSDRLYYMPFAQRGIVFDGGVLPVDMSERGEEVFLDLGRTWIMLVQGDKQLKGLTPGHMNILYVKEEAKREIVRELIALRSAYGQEDA